MTAPYSTCWTCGFSWPTGQDGSHICTTHLRATIKLLEDELEELRHRGPKSPEVRLNDDKTLDEVVATGATVQLEQLDYNHWFLEIGEVAVWLHAKTAIRANYELRHDATRSRLPIRVEWDGANHYVDANGVPISQDEMVAMLNQAAPSAIESPDRWRDAVTLAGLTPEKVDELWKSAMFESAANFRGYLNQGRLPAFGKGGEATLPERFVIKLVDHLLGACVTVGPTRNESTRR